MPPRRGLTRSVRCAHKSHRRNHVEANTPESLVKAVANVGVGFVVALLTQIIVFPLFSLEVRLGENLAIGLDREKLRLRSNPGMAVDEDGRRRAMIPGPALVLRSWPRYL